MQPLAVSGNRALINMKIGVIKGGERIKAIEKEEKVVKIYMHQRFIRSY